MVRSVTGEDVDMARLGGPEPHSRRSGVVHVVSATDAEALNMARAPAAEAVMAKDNLIFLGHSTGGIVARYVLERNQIPFREKKVGVVLIASPSAGSIYANWFDFLSKIYKNELGGLLTEGNTILAELDSRFSDMVYKKSEHIPHLIGREACENHMVLRRKIFGRFNRFIPPIRRVVEPASAWKYFGQGRMLPDTDHSAHLKATRLLGTLPSSTTCPLSLSTQNRCHRIAQIHSNCRPVALVVLLFSHKAESLPNALASGPLRLLI